MFHNYLLIYTQYENIGTYFFQKLSFYFDDDRYSTIASEDVRVAIVDVGIGGLNAALTLVDSNEFSRKNIVIYESNNRFDGHTYSKLWQLDQQRSEWYTEFLDDDESVMQNLIKRFNLQLVDVSRVTNSDYHIMFYSHNRFYIRTQVYLL